MRESDRDVAERFERRYAAIDDEIPPTPPFTLVGRRVSPGLLRPFLAAIAIIAVVAIALPMLGLPWNALAPQSSGQASGLPTSQPIETLRPMPDARFPEHVTGLPVISASSADRLLRSGKLDGRVVAVAGYYDAFYPSCPPTDQYIGPLEGWCSFTAFADTPDAARLCELIPNGSSCHAPRGPVIEPFFMPETSGALSTIFGGYDTANPLAMVLIGHAGDPRQWRCTAETQDACAHAFVVDRIAWALGREIPVTAPEVIDPWTNSILSLTPRMRPDDLFVGSELFGTVVSAAALRAKDVANVDPRWVLVGDKLVWLVRSVDAGQPDVNGSAPATVWLIDDATGAMIDHQPLAVASTYQAARLWEQARVHGYECCGGDTTAYFRVSSLTGDTLFEGYVTGSAQGSDAGYTTFGGGYNSIPLVLPAGEYTVTAWVGTYGAGVAGRHLQECSSRVALQALDSLTILADFPVALPCTIEAEPGPTAEP